MREIRLCDDCQKDLAAGLCIKNGLGIEIQSFHDPYLENQDALIQAYQALLAQIKGGKSLHAPFWELNTGTKMRGVRNETMEMFQSAYRIAAKLGCTEMVVHNGYIPGTSPYGAWACRSAEFWADFFQDKDDSITVCLENQFEADSEILRLTIDAVNDRRLKACLDVGHANANAVMPAAEWITTLGERIHYLHLHNNHGAQPGKEHNRDEHLGLADGTLDMRKLLRLAERVCPRAIWAIECGANDLPASIRWLQDEELMGEGPKSAVLFYQGLTNL